MGDLTKNISRSELACKCGCGSDSMDFETVNIVQESCDHFAKVLGVDKVILRLNSGNRCFKYNRSIGSNDRSQHPQGRAIDYTIDGVEPLELYNYLNGKYPGQYGMGKYGFFTHIDTRTGRSARW